MPYTFALSGHRKPSVGAVSSSASSGVMVCVAIVRRSSVRDERRGPLPSSRVRGRARGDREPSTAAPRARDALRAREEASTRRRSILSGRLRASALVVTAKKIGARSAPKRGIWRSVVSSDRRVHPKCRAVIGGDAWNHGRASASASARAASLLDRAVCRRHARDERRARSDEALEDDHRAGARAPSGARRRRARCVRLATRRPRRANRSVAVPAFPRSRGRVFRDRRSDPVSRASD